MAMASERGEGIGFRKATQVAAVERRAMRKIRAARERPCSTRLDDSLRGAFREPGDHVETESQRTRNWGQRRISGATRA